MSQELILNDKLAQAKNLARLLYLIHGASFVFSLGAFSFIPLIINYIKRPDTAGTFVHSHHTWMIRSFWFYLMCVVVLVSAVIPIIATASFAKLLLIIVGAIVAWLWKAYRLIRGFVDLNNNRAMPT